MMTTLAKGCFRTREVDESLSGSSVPVKRFQTTNSMINMHWTDLTFYGLPN